MTYDEVGPFYIYPLREGSDDCWDGPGFTLWTAREQCIREWESWPLGRYCAVWTGTADRDTLAQFRTTDSSQHGDN